MLCALIDRQYRQVACSAEPAVIEHGLQVPQDRGRSVREQRHVIQEARPGKMQHVLRHSSTLVMEQLIRIRSKNPGNLIAHRFSFPSSHKSETCSTNGACDFCSCAGYSYADGQTLFKETRCEFSYHQIEHSTHFTLFLPALRWKQCFARVLTRGGVSHANNLAGVDPFAIRSRKWTPSSRRGQEIDSDSRTLSNCAPNVGPS
jgi:hypothetical protein